MAEAWVLTGGIGAGKSTVARMLCDLGAEVVDADRIGHDVLRGPARAQVGDVWPQVMVDGEIDRAALGRIVFADHDELARLEAIVHPLIADEVRRRVSASDRRVTVVEVSVPKDLAGVGWERTVVAVLDRRERIARLVGRGMDRADIERRMASQPSDDGWAARGRWHVSTAGSLEEVRRRVDDLWETVLDR